MGPLLLLIHDLGLVPRRRVLRLLLLAVMMVAAAMVMAGATVPLDPSVPVILMLLLLLLKLMVWHPAEAVGAASLVPSRRELLLVGLEQIDFQLTHRARLDEGAAAGEQAWVQTRNHRYTARYLIDASGQSRLLARRNDAVVPYTQFGHCSVYTHFENARTELLGPDYDMGVGSTVLTARIIF